MSTNQEGRDERRERPFACCPRCGEPLVSTFEFRKKEWVCVACPAVWDWLSARAGAVSPEMQARYDEHKKRYDTGREQRRNDGTLGLWTVAADDLAAAAPVPVTEGRKE